MSDEAPPLLAIGDNERPRLILTLFRLDPFRRPIGMLIADRPQRLDQVPGAGKVGDVRFRPVIGWSYCINISTVDIKTELRTIPKKVRIVGAKDIAVPRFTNKPTIYCANR